MFDRAILSRCLSTALSTAVAVFTAFVAAARYQTLRRVQRRL